MNDFIYATTSADINNAFVSWLNESNDDFKFSIHRLNNTEDSHKLLIYRLYDWYMSTNYSNESGVIRFRFDSWSTDFQAWIQTYIKINENKPEQDLLSIEECLDKSIGDHSNLAHLEVTHLKKLSNDLIDLMSSEWALKHKMIIDPIYAATHKTLDHAFNEWIEETGDDERRLVRLFFEWFMATDIAHSYFKQTGLICFSFNAWVSEFRNWIEYQILANSLNEVPDKENPLTVKECLDINDASNISKLSTSTIRALSKQLIDLMSSNWIIKYKLGLDYLT